MRRVAVGASNGSCGRLSMSSAGNSSSAAASSSSSRRVVVPGQPPPAASSSSMPPLQPPPPRQPPPPTSVRHVSVPGAAFEVSSNGMGLKRKTVAGTAAAGSRGSGGGGRGGGGGGSGAMAGAAATRPGLAPGADAPGATAPTTTSIDFKRQRLADAARAAKSTVLCSYFCKHGRCDGYRGAECPFEHDPEQVSICQAFLHGTCQADAESPCPLSHTPRPHNMPICRLFTRGLCVDGSCQFSHVHLGSGAAVCDAFRRCGYCVDGAECGKRHELFCTAHVATGACPLGERCKLGLRLHAAARAGATTSARPLIPILPRAGDGGGGGSGSGGISEGAALPPEAMSEQQQLLQRHEEEQEMAPGGADGGGGGGAAAPPRLGRRQPSIVPFL